MLSECHQLKSTQKSRRDFLTAENVTSAVRFKNTIRDYASCAFQKYHSRLRQLRVSKIPFEILFEKSIKGRRPPTQTFDFSLLFIYICAFLPFSSLFLPVSMPPKPMPKALERLRSDAMLFVQEIPAPANAVFDTAGVEIVPRKRKMNFVQTACSSSSTQKDTVVSAPADPDYSALDVPDALRFAWAGFLSVLDQSPPEAAPELPPAKRLSPLSALANGIGEVAISTPASGQAEECSSSSEEEPLSPASAADAFVQSSSINPPNFAHDADSSSDDDDDDDSTTSSTSAARPESYFDALVRSEASCAEAARHSPVPVLPAWIDELAAECGGNLYRLVQDKRLAQRWFARVPNLDVHLPYEYAVVAANPYMIPERFRIEPASPEPESADELAYFYGDGPYLRDSAAHYQRAATPPPPQPRPSLRRQPAPRGSGPVRPSPFARPASAAQEHPDIIEKRLRNRLYAALERQRAPQYAEIVRRVSEHNKTWTHVHGGMRRVSLQRLSLQEMVFVAEMIGLNMTGISYQ
jgi:hypothetical protein